MPYRFDKAPAAPTFELPPVGDYDFIVTECLSEPRLKEDTLNYTLALKLTLIWKDQKIPIFANPWARSEKSITQDGRDDIASFLMSIGLKPGTPIKWTGLTGKKGRARIKHEKEQAKAGEENKGRTFARVDYYLVGGKGASTASTPEAATSATESEFEKARKAQIEKTRGTAEAEPDDLDEGEKPY